jgi:Ca2+-binding RTX toxin-like protein
MRDRGSRRIRALAIATLPMLAMTAVVAGPAGAGTRSVPTCTFDGRKVTATYGDPGVYGIVASLYQVHADGGELFFDQGGAIDCGATIATARRVVVIGTGGLDHFSVDEHQADFSGALPPIDARLGGGNDVLSALGIPNQVNTMVFGSAAMVINGTVVTYSPLARGELRGGDVDGDLLSGQGGGPAGGRFGDVLLAVAGAGATTIRGGDGPDVLKGDTGGRGDLIDGEKGQDAIQGSEGDDDLRGGPGADIVSGGGGNDRIAGNGGDDELSGDVGKDRLLGGPGSDEIDAQDGEKDVIDGGSNGGIGDSAFVDCGLDVVTRVEDVHC